MLTHYPSLRLLTRIISDLGYRKYDGGHPHRWRDALSCKYAVFSFRVDCSNLTIFFFGTVAGTKTQGHSWLFQ
jgi:hypothetical protein